MSAMRFLLAELFSLVAHKITILLNPKWSWLFALLSSYAQISISNFCRHASINSLLYVKEDYIIPHHINFHDLIRKKVKGKTGPLFDFGVHEDVRMHSDARIQNSESHAGQPWSLSTPLSQHKTNSQSHTKLKQFQLKLRQWVVSVYSTWAHRLDWNSVFCGLSVSPVYSPDNRLDAACYPTFLSSSSLMI